MLCRNYGFPGEDELEEPVDRQGQRMVRSSPCCILSVCHFRLVVVSENWSNGNHHTRDLRRTFRARELSVYLREALLSRVNPIPLTYTVASSFACTSPLSQPTVVGFLKTVTVSNSAELRSFLLDMCMLALESTNKFSFLLFHNGWRWKTPFVSR